MPTNQVQAAWPLKKPQHLVYVELGPSNGGMILGICDEGLSYRVVAPLIVDGPLNFAFALDGKNRLQGTGEIVWSEDGAKTGGLRFTKVTPQFREALRAWLASESVPKSVGREVTPAAATPLDSLEKIKETVREKTVVIPEPPPVQKPEEPKKQFKPRDWSTPISDLRAPAQKTPEPDSAETKPIAAPVEVKTAPPKLEEAKPIEPPRIEARPVDAKPLETKVAEPQAVESKPAQREPSEPKAPQKSAADFFLSRTEPKPEHLQNDSGIALPKLRLPFSSAPPTPETVATEPAAQKPQTPKTSSEPAATSKNDSGPEVAASSSAEVKDAPAKLSGPEEGLPTEEEVATALAAPGLLGLHEPKEFVPEEPSVEEASPYEFEPPRMNRAAATLIIGLALTIIFGALVMSFRREVGQTLIRAGQMLVGEEVKPPAERPSPAPTSTAPEDDSYPPVATPLKPANSQPQPATPANSTPGNSIRPVPDLPKTGAGNGQKEFEQARNILKGNHRQRDLPLAVSLLWTGVEKGYVSAEVTLADLYARGDGVEKSCAQARVLLEAAIRKGSPEARRRLEALRRQGCS